MYKIYVRSEGARERVGQFQSGRAALMAISRTQPECTRAGRLDEEHTKIREGHARNISEHRRGNCLILAQCSAASGEPSAKNNAL